MFIAVFYDVSSGRTESYKKLLRKHLEHAQNSVFYGRVSESQYKKIKNNISQMIQDQESVVIISTHYRNAVEVEEFGEAEDYDKIS